MHIYINYELLTETIFNTTWSAQFYFFKSLTNVIAELIWSDTGSSGWSGWSITRTQRQRQL